MQFLTFKDLQAQIQEHYQRGEYAEAFDLATQHSSQFPERSHLLALWRMSMSAATGAHQQALTILTEVLESGFWYSEVLLRKSPSLQPLQGVLEFERLVAWNAKNRRRDPQESFPMLVLRSQGRCSPGGPPCSSLLAFHGHGNTAQAYVDFWKPAASAGWLVAAPQSTQAIWQGDYIWDDRQAAESEAKKHFAELDAKYPLDPNRVVLAGHSTGGELALWLSLAASLPARGFIVFSPSGPFIEDPESLASLIREHSAPGLRGYLIAGDEDETIPWDGVHRMADLLNGNGIICELEEVPHAGLDFAPEYESSLLRALDFILPD